MITAFVIESYRRLQPDPNDAMLNLLAHIAEKLDGTSINGTMSVASIVANTGFSPSRTDITINVFWFISLVLSLTAALIGIITLQWLREHQRYDNAMKPKQRMSILNARLHSLQRWYVPQIFAGLPLLLQGALVLFFVGLFEFLFALRAEVAVPVTVSICIPLFFLATTTLLPTLQVCVLQDPFGLAVNNEVPSPCPYKSPQSLITRRLIVASQTTFKCLAYTVVFVYQCIATTICFFRELAGHQAPTFRSQRTYLQPRLLHEFPQLISGIRKANGDWTAIDLPWLLVRTTYATSLSLQLTHGRHKPKRTEKRFINLGPAFARIEKYSRDCVTLRSEVYDCTRSILKVVTGQNLVNENGNILYYCMQDLCSEPIDDFGDLETTKDVIDLCVAFSQLICYTDRKLLNTTYYPSLLTAEFIGDVLGHKPLPTASESQTADILRAAYMDTWVQHTRIHLGMPSRTAPTLWKQQEEVAARLMMNRLQISPKRLFQMHDSEAWLPNWNWFGSRYGRWIAQGMVALTAVGIVLCFRCSRELIFLILSFDRSFTGDNCCISRFPQRLFDDAPQRRNAPLSCTSGK